MLWCGISAPRVNGMEEKEFWWQHVLLVYTSAVVPLWRTRSCWRLDWMWGTIQGKNLRDSKRVKQAEARVDKQYKNYRIMGRQAKQRDEELRSNREGVTYEAGGFNDLGLSSGPSRKRKKKWTDIKTIPWWHLLLFDIVLWWNIKANQ